MPDIKDKKICCPGLSNQFTEAEIQAAKIPENRLFPFHSKASHSKIEEGHETPANLENSNNDELTSVQASREFTAPNGCHVKVFFSKKHDPGIRKEIARLLLTAFEQERIVDDETSHVSVQSIDQRTGRQ